MHNRMGRWNGGLARLILAGCLVVGTGASGTLATLPAWADAPNPAQVAPALLSKIRILGIPVARITIGTQVRVTGYVINTDTKQHDAYLAATLLDAHGHVVGHAKGLADNLPPGKKARYAIIGSVTAPRWARIRLTVVRVTENVGGAGAD